MAKWKTRLSTVHHGFFDRQDATPALAGGARESAKFFKVFLAPWRHWEW
jgi:hypothetical protein